MCQGLSWSDRRLTGRKRGAREPGAPPQSRQPITRSGEESLLPPPQGASSHELLMIYNWQAGVRTRSKHWSPGGGESDMQVSAVLLLVARWSQCAVCALELIWVCHVQWGNTVQCSFALHAAITLSSGSVITILAAYGDNISVFRASEWELVDRKWE